MNKSWFPAAREFIAEQEGERLQAYRDSCGIWTIGTGFTRIGGKPVFAGQRISPSQCADVMDFELGRTAAALDRLVKVSLEDHEAVALASFTFNLGAGALQSSTLLRKLNGGDRKGAAVQFLAWDKGHVNGRLVEIAGLKARRVREQAMFLHQSVTDTIPHNCADALMQAELDDLQDGQ